jgi:Zn-dependent protease
VLLLEPEPTQFDLHFRLPGLDVPVRVHPMFWVLTAVLGWGAYAQPPFGLGFVLLWVACVFLSVLIHELGHVLAGRAFGSSGYIVLYSFGGLAVGSSDLPRRWQRIVVYAAGPGAQFLVLGLVWLTGPRVFVRLAPAYPLAGAATYLMLWQINLYWPLLNLLPIWPLDGGRISREVLEGAMGQRGVEASLVVSMVVAGAAAADILLWQHKKGFIPYLEGMSMYSALFFGLFCLENFQALQYERSRRQRWDDRLPWE